MKKIIYLGVMMLAFTGIYAQDGQLSYVYASPLAINPASTGNIAEGKWRVMSSFRKQWSSFIDKGIVNYTLSFDAPFNSERVALGALFYNNSASDGAVKNISAAISFAYNIYINYSAKTKLVFGIQAGFGQKSFEPDKLTFDNQYVPGFGFDPSMDSKEHFSHTSVMYPDFSFGTLIFKEERGSKKFFPWIGFSAFHLTEPNESFSSEPSRLPRKYIISTGSIIKSSEKFSFEPHILMINQASVFQFNAGCTFNVDLNKVTTLMFGAYFRSEDAGIAMLGIDYNRYTLQFVYDINTSSLNPVTRGFGGYEVTLKYVMTSKARAAKY